MGFDFWVYPLIFSLFLHQFPCQEPNTDGFFVSEFFKQMGLNSSKGYNFSTPFCSWQGLFCDTQNQHVIVLIASNLGLSGSIPDTTIGKLNKLQFLDLSNNKISGLPSDFWSLTTLKNLNLSFNEISGSFSSNVGNFGQLESLDISHNKFSGEIPEDFDSLVSLRVLKLDNNGFQMSIPRGFLGCKSLVSIDLSSNLLEGSLPDGFSSAFPKLKSLNLAGNQINGSYKDFAEMKSISFLNISGNRFEGSVTGLFMENLEVADFSKNQFQGNISQVDSNWFGLIYLDLSENKLNGDICKNLTLLKKLKHLNLAWNRFNQWKFPKIELLSGLEYLNLSNTNLSGHIPKEISELSDLNTFDVSGNRLSGHVPMLSIKNLAIIDASRNNLTGELPVSVLEKLPWMAKFNFSFNNLTFCTNKFSPETLTRSFFGSTNSCPIAANPALFKRRGSVTGGLKLALTVTLSAMFLLVGALLFVAFGCRRNKPKSYPAAEVSFKDEQSISGPFSFQTDSTTWVADVKQVTSVPVIIFEKPLLNITFCDLLSATSNFDKDTLLADGKFGPVYRCYLPGGIHVAVKVLVHGSTLNDQEAAKEFEFLGRIKHPNLVPLTGYCIAGDQRIAIYEYMENGNLQNLLHDLPFGVQTIDDWSTDTWEEEAGHGIENVGPQGLVSTWRFRHMVALGTARALAFLHHGCSPPMIHRDVKSSSVYLDLNKEPRLSDFGLAKVFGNGLEDEIASGSPGYLPPEFSQSEHELPTPKSDVYCFGVVLFELITGKKPIEDDYLDEKYTDLVTWVRSLVRKSEGSRAIDPNIHETGSEEQIEEALKIGYLCTADLPCKRPSMQQVVGLLKDIEPKPNL